MFEELHRQKISELEKHIEDKLASVQKEKNRMTAYIYFVEDVAKRYSNKFVETFSHEYAKNMGKIHSDKSDEELVETYVLDPNESDFEKKLYDKTAYQLKRLYNISVGGVHQIQIHLNGVEIKGEDRHKYIPLCGLGWEK